MKSKVAKIDEDNLKVIRKSVSDFVKSCAKTYDQAGSKVLDIAPQDHEGIAPYFTQSTIETLDIEPSSGATYIADLCQDNSDKIPSEHFDAVVCTEVLEHTLQPFDAAKEIHRMLRPNGTAIVTVPFNFRIHGPLPDCWRITEHGLRALFKDFKEVVITSIETQDRFLMPIHYRLIAKK